MHCLAVRHAQLVTHNIELYQFYILRSLKNSQFHLKADKVTEIHFIGNEYTINIQILFVHQ